MNLGKMGIQICEKPRESLGWRQIGSCHKWDSKAGLLGHQGTRATCIQHTACQSRLRPFPDCCAETETPNIWQFRSLFLMTSIQFCYLVWPLYLNRESHFSASKSILIFTKSLPFSVLFGNCKIPQGKFVKCCCRSSFSVWWNKGYRPTESH